MVPDKKKWFLGDNSHLRAHGPLRRKAFSQPPKREPPWKDVGWGLCQLHLETAPFPAPFP